MAEIVRVDGVPVDQRRLGEIFAELRAHHWLAIPEGYQPDMGRFHATEGCVGTLESVVHDLMASGSMPAWFRQRFMGRAHQTLF